MDSDQIENSKNKNYYYKRQLLKTAQFKMSSEVFKSINLRSKQAVCLEY